MSELTVITDPQVVKAEVVDYIGSIIEDARNLAAAVNDDATAAQAIDFGAKLKEKTKWLKERRKAIYEPLKSATEAVRLEYDNPLKLADQIERTLSAAVITYKQKKRAEEERIRLAAEAEARRQKEEADRLAREAAAERDRIIKQRQIDEQKRRDYEAMMDDWALAIAEDVRRAEVIKAKKEADERAKQLKEEEDRRLANAKTAEDHGLTDRAETIIETQKPVASLPAPLPTAADVAAKAEAARQARETELAEAKRKEDARIAEEKKRQEEADRLKKLDEEAAIAKAKATEAEAAATQQITVERPDTRMRTSVSWKYDVPDVAAVKKLCLAIAQGRAPVEYIGFDPENPQKFRAAAIQKDVTRMKDQFQGDVIGIRTWPEESGSFKAAA